MKQNRGPQNRIDWGTFGGLGLALAGMLGGLLLEGGRVHDVAQITAAAIVLGGTLGAVLISNPWAVVHRACARIPEAIFPRKGTQPEELADYLVSLARHVRRAGMASLEDVAKTTEDPFLRKALGIAADGLDTHELRQIMELEMDMERRQFEADAAVFEAAGGYAPTIGIIGAVLGLIQVMKHLDHLDEVGRGIAVAFVATVYGVALANVLLLPLAAKIHANGQSRIMVEELILTGVLAITAGTNPRVVELHLGAFRSVPADPGTPGRSRTVRPGKITRIG